MWNVRTPTEQPGSSTHPLMNMITTASDTLKAVYNLLPNSKEVEKVVVEEVVCKVKPKPESNFNGKIFLAIGGLSGAAAIGLNIFRNELFPDMSQTSQSDYDGVNKLHFLNSLALCCVPLTGKPMLVGCVLTLGLLVYAGTGYYTIITEEEDEDDMFANAMMVGGGILIVGWLCMIL